MKRAAGMVVVLSSLGVNLLTPAAIRSVFGDAFCAIRRQLTALTISPIVRSVTMIRPHISRTALCDRGWRGIGY